jgi:plastocyanin
MLAAAACGSGGSTDAARKLEAASVANGSDEVVMRLIAYKPATLEVPAGTSVTWKQQDAGFHTVTSGSVSKDASGSVKTNPDAAFDSGQLAKGQEFTHTFGETGTFKYFCRVHPATMSGRVTVQ